MAVRNDIHQACKAEGLALMGDVFDVILDRGDVTVDDVASVLDHRSVESLYDRFVGPAIDAIEDTLMRERRAP